MTQYRAQWADGTVVRWRALSWAEYRRFQARLAALDPAMVCDLYLECRIEGPAPELLPAGVARFVVEHVMADNPFSGELASVKKASVSSRQQIQSSYFHQAQALLVRAFHCSLEEIDKWDSTRFFERLAMAEMIVGTTLEAKDPKASSPEVRKPKVKRPMNLAQTLAAERVRDRDRSSPG
jgi:hypothetical protein